ncbi:23S rRNA (adenine(2503)-C(2))-methyltransferase RlmN, partial [[Eubacterium] siraeum]|nr:23S rRNA (adenine(2503)-C(2))-methyltransferase RlmN [[Eubacterium] siraeum]
LIDGVNDNRQSADALLKMLKGQNCHVNLIPVNEIKEGVFKRSASVEKYKQMLIDGGLYATVSSTLGADISAACGQLRRDYK